MFCGRWGTSWRWIYIKLQSLTTENLYFCPLWLWFSNKFTYFLVIILSYLISSRIISVSEFTEYVFNNLKWCLLHTIHTSGWGGQTFGSLPVNLREPTTSRYKGFSQRNHGFNNIINLIFPNFSIKNISSLTRTRIGHCSVFFHIFKMHVLDSLDCGLCVLKVGTVDWIFLVVPL